MLTALPPQWVDVANTDSRDWYIQPGEPIGVRHLCARGVQELFGIQLRRGECALVHLDGHVAEVIQRSDLPMTGD